MQSKSAEAPKISILQMAEEQQPSPENIQPHPRAKRRSAKQVPLLLDIFFSVSRLIVIIVGLLTVTISIFAGASLVWAVVRAGAAMLTVGLLLWLASWLVARGALESTRLELLQALKASEEAQAATSKRPFSTIETEA